MTNGDLRPRSGLSTGHILPGPHGLVLALVFILALTPVEDSDLFLHLATGRVVMSGTIPSTDPFSHTSAGQPWLAHEWLAGTLFELGYRLGGLGLLVWLKALAAVLFLLLVRSLAAFRGVSSELGITVVVAAAAIAVKNVILVRPHLVTLLFLPLTQLLVDRGGWRILFALVPMFVVWANCHGGFVLGALPFITSLAQAGIQALGGAAGARRRLVEVAVAGLVVAAAICVNPHGPRIFAFPFMFDPKADFLSVVDEWAPPDYKRFPAQECLVIALVVLPLVWPVRPGIGDTLGFVAALHLALTAIRNQFMLGIYGAPILGRAVEEGRAGPVVGWIAGRFELAARGKGAILPVALVALATLPWALRTDFVDPARFPRSAVAWIEKERPAGPVFNDYDHGGYLIWALPGYPVFIDGRVEIHHRNRVLADYMSIVEARPGYEAVLDRRGVNLLVVRRISPIASALERSDTFRRALCADGVEIFVRAEAQKTRPPRTPGRS